MKGQYIINNNENHNEENIKIKKESSPKPVVKNNNNQQQKTYEYKCKHPGCNKEYCYSSSLYQHFKSCHSVWYNLVIKNKPSNCNIIDYLRKLQNVNSENINNSVMNINTSNNAEMIKICDALKLKKVAYTKVNLYGYSSHLAVYQDIIHFVKLGMKDKDEAIRYISNLTANKMRDIKSKIGSDGKCGKKQAMKDGITKMLSCLILAFNESQAKNEMNDNKMEIDDFFQGLP